MHRVGAVGILVLVCAVLGGGCGLRASEPTTRQVTAVSAPVTTTTSPLPARDVTGSTVAVAGAASSTSTAAPTTTTTATTTAPTTAPPAPTTAAGAAPAAFCTAARTYGADDLLGLGGRVIADPAGVLAAYDSLVANAPAAVAPQVTAMGPLTRAAVQIVRSGQITTTAALQKWLAADAPRDELEQWVAGQQVLVPALARLCP